MWVRGYAIQILAWWSLHGESSAESHCVRVLRCVVDSAGETRQDSQKSGFPAIRIHIQNSQRQIIFMSGAIVEGAASIK